MPTRAGRAKPAEVQIPLEESLKTYAEGTALVKLCLARLDRAEAMIKELSADGLELKDSALRGDAKDGDEDGGPEQDDFAF